MYVVEVIPLSVLPPNVPQILSYYHDEELPKGAVVEIVLNNRSVTGVVVGSSIVESQKLLLRKSAFELKKIESVASAAPQVSEYQFKMALWLANNYVAPLGLCLNHVLPPFFGKKKYPISAAPVAAKTGLIPKPQTILCRAKESYEHLHEELAKMPAESQALIVVPEISHIAYFKNRLPDAAVLSSQTSNQEWYRIWTGAQDGSIRIVIGTRQTLTLPFSNLGALFIVDPLHEFYKSDLSPKYRTADFAEMVAELHGARYVSISNILSVSGYHNEQQHKLVVQDFIKPWPTELQIIDIIGEMKHQYVGLFASQVKTRLAEAVRNYQKVLILSARRGYTGILLCQHCGFSFKCPNCDVPMRVHQGADLTLICHRCGIAKPYPQFCSNCHSSNVKPTGAVGSQKIFEELQKMLENGQLQPPSGAGLPILVLDSDVTQNQTEEDEIMDTVHSKSPVILIATQKVFSYIFDVSFDHIIIPQFDALLGTTDFQASRYLWYQLEKLADFGPKLLTVQTFHPKELVPALAAHRYQPLYEEELQLRALFKYPPFSRLVKLTFSHPSIQRAVNESRGVVEKIKMAAVHLQAKDRIVVSETSPALIRKEKGVYIATVIIKVFLNGDKNLLRSVLRYVPSHWLIDVDPRTTT